MLGQVLVDERDAAVAGLLEHLHDRPLGVVVGPEVPDAYGGAELRPFAHCIHQCLDGAFPHRLVLAVDGQDGDVHGDDAHAMAVARATYLVDLRLVVEVVEAARANAADLDALDPRFGDLGYLPLTQPAIARERTGRNAEPRRDLFCAPHDSVIARSFTHLHVMWRTVRVHSMRGG